MSVDLASAQTDVHAQESIDWLSRLLGKTLRVHLTDGRMMCGTFKCTDKDRNIILAQTHEYRHSPTSRTAVSPDPALGTVSNAPNVTTRFIGLITVGGQYITKIEIEEFDPSSIT